MHSSFPQKLSILRRGERKWLPVQLWANTPEPWCHSRWTLLSLAKQGDIAELKQSDWFCQWKSGEVKGHKRWWPAQLPNILSVKQVSVSDATWLVWVTLVQMPVSPRCRSLSQRGSPVHRACSVCWPSLYRSWGSSSSSLLLFLHEAVVWMGQPWVDEGQRMPL